ncbi:MAG: dihydrolipoyl dehydrogenase family protein [Spirochaetia bacterium]
MSQTNHFDLVIIGTGVAATSAAFPAKKAGWSVAVVEKDDIGGTCPNRGCDPKKVLAGMAALSERANRMADKGMGKAPGKLNWKDLMEYKRTFTAPMSDEIQKAFEHADIKIFRGKASFVSGYTLDVDGTAITGDHFLIASGSEPMKLNIPGEEHLLYSRDFLKQEELPEKPVFIGGGYISFEFAHIAARAGAQPIILEMTSRPLAQFDSVLVEMISKESYFRNINIQVNAKVTKIEKTTEGLDVHTSSPKGDEIIQADAVFHGAGRVPSVLDLDLEKTGVKATKEGVLVNKYLQSISNPKFYAAGDVSSFGIPLTPVAAAEGAAAVKNMLEGNSEVPDFASTASVVFTFPPIAMAGLTEQEAKDRRIDCRVNFQDTSSWYTARQSGVTPSAFKTIIDKQTGKILGAHILGFHAEEIINLFALAIEAGLTAEQIKRTIFAYPTSGSDIGSML